MIRDLIYAGLVILVVVGPGAGCAPNAPVGNKDVPPDVVPDLVETDGAADVTVDMTPDITPDVTPDVAPDLTEEIAPDLPPDCPADSIMLEEECVSEQTVACADITPPANAHQVDAEVTIAYTDADGWTEPTACLWECYANFDLLEGACVDEQTVPCADTTPPDNAHQLDEDVTIPFTEADGWAEPAECAWECDEDFELLEEFCINEMTVACTDITPPDNAHQVDGTVTITYTDADGWTDAAECDWECDADFDLVNGNCIDQQFVACGAIVAPDNAHQVIAAVEVTYTDEDGWSEAPLCTWECDEDFDLDAETCINQQTVDCTDIAPPENASQVEGSVDITYSDADGWTEPTDCAWECNADFDLLEGNCIDEQIVDCADIVAPANAHQTEETVAISYTDADGWAEPEECAWECDADFDLMADACINERSVDCADIAAPGNAHQVEGAVTITFTDADGWTEPAKCEWACDANFDLVAGDCIDEQAVPCADIVPPSKAQQIEAIVTITYTDANGWTIPMDCAWECDADHDLVDEDCIDLQVVACADIIPPDNSHQVEGDVLVTYTDADGWTDPADCGWECDVGYLTEDDLLCDICDNDLGYWAFGLEEDCSESGWEDQGTTVGSGSELEMLEDGQGGAFMVWSQATLSKPDISIQRILPDGTVSDGWPADGLVVCDDESSQDSPALTHDGAGGVFVAWRDTRNPRPSIYAQHVLANGAADPAWSKNGELVYEGGDYQEVREPQLATDAAGGAYITWWGYTGTNSSSFIMVRRIAGDGSFPAGWDEEKSLAPIGGQSISHAVADTAGGAWITWNGPDGCRVTRIAAGGEMAPGWGGNGIVMSQPPAAFGCMQPAADGSGGLLIPWYNSGGWETGYDIYVQRVLPDGTKMWSDGNDHGGVRVSAGEFHEIFPSVAADGNGGAFLAWEDARAGEDVWDGTKHEIYAAHILNGGTVDPLWPAYWLQLSTTAIGYHTSPRMLPDGSGGTYAIWIATDDQNMANPRIRVTRVAANGTFAPGWAVDGALLNSDMTWVVDNQRIVADTELGIISGWVAAKQNSATIRSLRVFGNGVIPQQ